MVASLTLKYRPATFSDVIGQRLSATVLSQMVETDSVPQGLIFSGPSGTGKTSMARILAKTLDAPETIEIDAASHGGVADIRGLIETLRYGFAGTHRVVIIDEAQSVTREGFEALLKVVEEPPPGTIFILVTTEPHKIPETILSRVIEFEFRRITPAELFDRLVHVVEREDLGITSDLMLDIAQRAQGNARVALNLLEQAHRASIRSKEEFENLIGDRDSAPRIVAAMAVGDGAKALEVLDEELQIVGQPQVIAAQITRLFRDIFVLRGGGRLSLSGPALSAREQLAAQIDIDRVYAAIKIMWDLKTKTRVSDDPRGNLESATILVNEVLNRGRQVKPASPPPPVAEAPAPVKRMTLAGMKGTPNGE